MLVLVLRHGIAEETAKDGTDAARALTPEGVRKTREAVTGLARFAPRPDAILTSPKVRAVQTAELAGAAFEREPIALAELGDEDAEAVVRKLRRRREGTVLLVGHEPALSQVVQLLCGLDANLAVLDLRKAGCACVEIPADGAPGCLLWLATPAMLREIGNEIGK